MWFVVQWQDGEERRREAFTCREEAELLARIVSQTDGRDIRLTRENRSVTYLPNPEMEAA